MIRRVIGALVAGGLVMACGVPSEEEDGASDDALVGAGIAAMAAAPNDPCVATLVYLQKDAYRASGRSSSFWPPHTTTVVEVTCQTSRGEQHIAPFHDNRGAKPGTKDAKGNDVLVKAETDPNAVTVNAPWSEMQHFVESYESCSCDPAGFLGLETIDVQGKPILEKLSPILACPNSNDALLLALKEGRFGDAKEMFEDCRLDLNLIDLARAAIGVGREVKKLYNDSHLCNNDAQLQTDLFKRFRDNRDVSACDPHDREACYGPTLYFNAPKKIR